MMKLCSFNCKSVRRSVEHIRDLCNDCHVIGLQETWLKPEALSYLDTIHKDFSSCGTSAIDVEKQVLIGRPYGGVALLWRTDVLENVQVIDCNNSSLCAIKSVLHGNNFLFVSVYMPQCKEANLPDFTSILSLVQSLIQEYDINYAYILGDYNANIGKGTLFGKELVSFCTENDLSCADYDILRTKGMDIFTFQDGRAKTWLDHCVTTPLALASISEVYAFEDVMWSDHKPLFVTCSFNFDLGGSSRPASSDPTDAHLPEFSSRWGKRNGRQCEYYSAQCSKCLSMLDWPMLRKLCDCDCGGLCQCSDHRALIDSVYCKFIGTLLRASRRRSRGQDSAEPVKGWNEYVREAHFTARRARSDWMAANAPTEGALFDEMQTTRKIFKSRLKFCQTNEDKILLDKMSQAYKDRNFRQFWKHSGTVLKSKGRIASSMDGLTATEDIANLFRNNFLAHGNSPVSGNSLEPDCLPAMKQDVHISEQMVFDALRKMKLGKSVGHDNVSVEHLRFGGPWVVVFLSVLFNACIRHAYLPKEMLKTVIIPIVKSKTSSLTDSSNYRPISLATCCAKLYDSILLGILSQHIHVHDAQFGFQKGGSTDGAIFTMKQTIQHYLSRNTTVFACFLDLSRAFDRVNYSLLWKKLGESGVPSSCIKLLAAWYSNQTNLVRWCGSDSSEFKLACGVRQGGLTSPLLFNLYVNKLIVDLSSTRVGCHIGSESINNLSFADDMVLLSPSIAGLRVLLRICEGYAASHNLLYNTKKSVCIAFTDDGKKRASALPVCLAGTPLEWVYSFRYLGHLVCHNLRDSQDLERERRALCVRANMIARRFSKCSNKSKLALFAAYCQPLYTPQLWKNYTKEEYRRLKVQYNDAFRVLFRLPRFCSASEMFAQARVAGLDALIRNRVARFRKAMFGSQNKLLAAVTEHCTGLVAHWTKLIKTFI
ncbi:hypothetical protein O0L34_g17527 [Tuta absoluta]|nr:hypothetical protein O0L34_g17527 [Tuta absoluta]